jgi:multiple sugar transport system ATP-binding protein
VSEVALDAVTKHYSDGTMAVNGLSVFIEEGEFMVMVGPSGCGKTTALRMIAGLEEITSGTLRIGGRIANHLPPKSRDIAMVFQNYALYPHMSVRDNMGFSLRLARVPGPEVTRRVGEVADTLDLTTQLDRKPANLSGGQRQRVAMGRAIVREPQVFLMDEPLSNLDAKLRVHMRVELARLQRRLGTTTVYVTHDQTEAMTLGHRVAVMRDGVLQQVDTPTELYRRPANQFVAGFVGSPPMNFMRATATPEGAVVGSCHIRLPRSSVAALNGDREVILGIRPDALRLQNSGGIPVRVSVIESLGGEAYAYGPTEMEGTDAVDLVLRVDPLQPPGRGQLVHAWPDEDRLLAFSAATGQRVEV